MNLLKQLKTEIATKISKELASYTGDLNDIKTTGFVYARGTATNIPVSGHFYFLTTIAINENNVYQRATRLIADLKLMYTYERQCVSGTWTEWRKSDGTVLWENPNPTAEFAAQTITLSSSDYNFLEIYFKDSNTCQIEKITKGYGTRAIKVIGEGNGSYIGIRMRSITYVNDTTYSITDGVKKDCNETGEAVVYNNVLVPIKIIGY